MSLKQVRKYCLWCCNGNPKEVRQCPSKDCPLYNFRSGHKYGKSFTIKLIKKKCLDCGEGTAQAVRKCEFKDCPLYDFRNGTNPKLKGKGGNISNLTPFKPK
jgi:hypothetical protein